MQFLRIERIHSKPGSHCFLRVVEEKDSIQWIEPTHLTQLASGNSAAGNGRIECHLTTSSPTGTVSKGLHICLSINSTFVVDCDHRFIAGRWTDDGGSTC